MSLSKIPVEVVEGNLFKYLSWNDLLRLRRVSKHCRDLVQGYFNTDKGSERAPELSVGPSGDDDYPDLKTLTDMNIPTTRIYFHNLFGRKEVTHEDEIWSFVEKYGGKVKHLRLERCFMYSVNYDHDTAQLLRGLPHLESLSVDQLLPLRPDREYSGPVLPYGVLFQNLKALELHVDCREIPLDRLNDGTSGLEESLLIWLTECRALQKLRLSLKTYIFQRARLNLILRRVLEALILAVDTGDQWESVEFDADYSWVEGLTVDVFQRLLATCAAKNVGVAGVNARCLENRRTPQRRRSRALISSAITDLRVNWEAPDLRHWKLNKLTTLEICSAFMGFEDGQGQEGTSWSAALQSLNVTMGPWGLDVDLLFRQLSGGQPLIVLRKASLKFEHHVKEVQASQCLENLVNMAPNLKELTLDNWNGPPEAFARLLPRLRALEKLSLEYCHQLGDEAFVGNDPTKPAFLQLKNLRRLSVENWKLPGTVLTVNCFTSVFRHMSLSHFEMRSNDGKFSMEFQEPCNWLKLLLEGPFAESIEEIKWNGFRLHEVENAELREIGKAFRSYNML